MSKSQTEKINRVSEKTLRDLPFPDFGERTYTITDPAGLTIRVRAGGSKSFYARLWNPRSKKVLRRKLGEWPHMSCVRAIKALEKIRKELLESRWQETVDRPTLSEAYNRYKKQKTIEQKSTSFLQQIDQAWRCIPTSLRRMELDDVPLHSLADLVISVAVERKGTAFHVRRLLKAIYKMAVTNEWCIKDRTITIAPIKLRPKRLLVDNDQITIVLNTARQHPDKHKVCALLLCAATGQRGAEIMRLHWEDVLPDRIIFPAEIRKQREEHIVWLNELAREALSYLPRGTGPIFPMAHRNWLSDFGKVQARKAKVAGFGVHQLRKAVISNLLSAGVPLHVVQQVSGHKDTAVLLRHYAISTEKQTQTATQNITF